MKRVSGIFEVVFDVLYLLAALLIGFILLTVTNMPVAGGMALILASGDAFHLIPRILVVITGQEEKLRPALGTGKQITSVTMTIFYLLLWQLGNILFPPGANILWQILICSLAVIRIILCLLPQNRWREQKPPLNWGIWRNIPFFLMGLITAGMFFIHRSDILSLRYLWLAILMSFAFYLPVVLCVNKNPKIGMLMLPKTCMYLWMLTMFTAI